MPVFLITAAEPNYTQRAIDPGHIASLPHGTYGPATNWARI
jgi:hypothetical protein